MTFSAQGLVRAMVAEVERLSPSFLRITFGGPEFSTIGAAGPRPGPEHHAHLIHPGGGAAGHEHPASPGPHRPDRVRRS